MSQANVVCHVPDCKYNPNPGAGYCECAPGGYVVLGFVEMHQGEPMLKCWSYVVKNKGIQSNKSDNQVFGGPGWPCGCGQWNTNEMQRCPQCSSRKDKHY